jgi:hypothetical protein
MMMMMGSGSILHLGATVPRSAREASGLAFALESEARSFARSPWHSGLSLVAGWAGWGGEHAVGD